MGIFDTISKQLSALTSVGGPTSVVGIDIGTSSIKIVQLRKEKGKAILETYGSISLGPYTQLAAGQVTKLTPDVLATALKDLVRESNVTATNAGVAVPFAASLVTVIEVPPMSDADLQRVIPLEARKYIPVPMSEVMLDWFVIPKDDFQENIDPSTGAPKKEVIEVLLVAIRNDTLTMLQNVMQESGITADFYELEVFSAARSSMGHGVAPVMLIDVGAATTKVTILERGIVRMSHIVNFGGQEMSLTVSRAMNWDFARAERVKKEEGLDAPDTTQTIAGTNAALGIQPLAQPSIRTTLLATLGRIFPEAQKVLLNYGRKYQKNVSHVILTGGGSTMHGLLPFITERLATEVTSATPFDKIESPAFLVDVLKEVGPEFSVACGLALRSILKN